MSLPRRIARPLVAAMFIAGGVDALGDPAAKAPAADKVTRQIPGLREQDSELLVKVNGGVQLVAGTMFAFGRVPRLSALALAVSLVPTTMAGHRFWEYEDPAQRQQQQIHFLKNASMLGGLLLAAVDTEGKPGLAWRSRHAAGHAGAAVRRSRREARLAAKAARAKLAR